MSKNIPPKGANSSNSDYPVGYGKPPVHSQFGAGNKMGRGRPKGAKNLKTIVNEALSVKVSAKINGKIVKCTKAELALHQLANKASAGDLKAIDKLIAIQERYGPQEDAGGPTAEEIQITLDTLRDHLAFFDLFREPTDQSDD